MQTTHWRVSLPGHFAEVARIQAPPVRPGAQTRAFWKLLNERLAHGTRRSKINTVDGQNPFRTTWKPWESIVCWYLRGNHPSRVSEVVQSFVHPQYYSTCVKLLAIQSGFRLACCPCRVLRSYNSLVSCIQEDVNRNGWLWSEKHGRYNCSCVPFGAVERQRGLLGKARNQNHEVEFHGLPLACHFLSLTLGWGSKIGKIEPW